MYVIPQDYSSYNDGYRNDTGGTFLFFLFFLIPLLFLFCLCCSCFHRRRRHGSYYGYYDTYLPFSYFRSRSDNTANNSGDLDGNNGYINSNATNRNSPRMPQATYQPTT